MKKEEFDQANIFGLGNFNEGLAIRGSSASSSKELLETWINQ